MFSIRSFIYASKTGKQVHISLKIYRRSCDDHQSPGARALHGDGGAGVGGDQPHRDAERHAGDSRAAEIRGG